MPSRSAAGKKKRPLKALALKKAAAKKAATCPGATSGRKHAARGKENQPPVTAAPVSVDSTVSTSMLTSVNAAAVDVLTTIPHEDVEQAEIAILRGKYFIFSVRILFLLFSFLAQLLAVRNELRVAQEAAASFTMAGSSTAAPSRIPHPHNIKNLQAVMGLANDFDKYHEFRVSVPLFQVSLYWTTVCF